MPHKYQLTIDGRNYELSSDRPLTAEDVQGYVAKARGSSAETPSEQPKEPGYFQRLGAAEKENLQSMASKSGDIMRRTAGEVESIGAIKDPSVASLGQLISGVKGAFQLGGNVLGAAGNAAFLPISAAFAPSKEPGQYSQRAEPQPMVPGAPVYAQNYNPAQATQFAEEKIIGPAARAYSNLSPDMRQTLESAMGYTTLLGGKPGAGAMNNIRKGIAKAAPEAATAAKAAGSEAGAIYLYPKNIDEINIAKYVPIDDVEKVLPAAAEQVKPPVITGKDIAATKTAAQTKPKLFEGIKEQEAKILSATKEGEVADFGELAKAQAEAMDKYGIEAKPNAMAIASRLMPKATQRVKALRQEAGTRINGILERAQKEAFESGRVIPTEDIKGAWNEMVGKYFNAEIDESGKLVPIYGKTINVDKSQIRAIEDFTKKINEAGDAAFPIELNGVRQYIEKIANDGYKNQRFAINSEVQSAGKEIGNFIDNYLGEIIGKNYAVERRKYAILKSLERNMAKRMGDIVNPTTGETQYGSGLLKSALMSMSDRTTNEMFRQIKELTGIDLYRSAAYAELAMKATNDPRIADIFKAVQKATGQPVTGLTGAAAGQASKMIGEKLTKDASEKYLQKLVDFYNRAQGKK